MRQLFGLDSSFVPIFSGFAGVVGVASFAGWFGFYDFIELIAVTLVEHQGHNYLRQSNKCNFHHTS